MDEPAQSGRPGSGDHCVAGQGDGGPTTAPSAGGCQQTEKNSWDSYDTVFLNSKAGMDGVDKKKVQKVVYEMSKGSRYFDNEQRKEAAVQQRVHAMAVQAAGLTPVQLAVHEKAADAKIVELEATRDLSRIWLHVDMDAFYAAVETLDNPGLAGKPMAVGGMSMICTANYEARKFGVRAAMPGFIARKLCSDLIFVRPDFEKYTRYSELSRKVFQEYDPNFVARSLDEAYLDITDACRSQNMSAAEVAEELRNRVHAATGLTCSAGVGPNRLLAKVCSDIKKPNGQFVLCNDRTSVMAFISALPIRKVSGIGKVTERVLKEVLGITICADLLTKRALISALFSEISTDFFLAVALGIGGSDAPQEEQRKSLSNERTFAAISKESDLLSKLEELAHALAEDMQKENLQGRTLTLKLKTTGFEVRTRAMTLPSFIYKVEDILVHATKLLRGELPISIRLMGLRMSHFKGEKLDLSDKSQRTLTTFLPQLNSSGLSAEPLDTEGRQHTSNWFAASPDVHTDEPCPGVEGSCAHPCIPHCGDAHLGELFSGGNDDKGKSTAQLVCDASQSKSPLKGARAQQRTLDTFIVLPGQGKPCPAADPSKCLGMSSSTSNCEAHTDAFHVNGSAGVPTNDRVGSGAPESIPEAPGCTEAQVHDLPLQIWVDDNCCSICGLEVNDCMPSARQEHEDYHLAVALQREDAGVPTQQTRRTESVFSNKRKPSGTSTGQQHAPKRNWHVPIEAFFKKPNT